MSVDLHIHTTASDGSMSPKQVVEMAANLNLKAIAISDHDTVDGIEEALIYGKKLGIKVIPAIEFSSRFNDRDIHILGFFIDYRNHKLHEFLNVLRKERVERAGKIVDCLRRLGLDIDFDEVLSTAGGASVGRPHIAKVLLAKGYIETFSDAFSRYLKRGAPCFIEKFVYPLKETIDIIHEVGGFAVFAHPGLARLDEHLHEFIAMGLDGVEAYHTEHSEQDTERYIKLARENNLVVSGGSDCHGIQSTHGLRLGTVYVSDEVVDDLERMIENRS